MGRNQYSAGKRERDLQKARKKNEKAERRAARRERGPREIPIGTVEEVTGALPSVAEAMAALKQRRQADRSASTIPCKLFVGGLSWETTGTMLEEAFSRFGRVQEAVVVKDRSTGQSRGFGFVTMADRRKVAAVISGMDGADLDGRTLLVKVATENKR